MQPPIGPSGFPTVSATQLRTYGAGGFRLAEQEEARGCPRQYHAKYVEHRVREERPYELEYGGFFHRVLYLLEAGDLTPDEALERAFPADADPAMFVEARKDLTAYLERGASPTDRFATIAVETELDAELYVDETYGPVHYRGFIDWLGVDPNLPGVLHVVDYKTNRHPPHVEDVRGDVQMKGYHWLVARNARRFGFSGTPRIVTHLDAVKFREVEVTYRDEDIDDWHGWAVAVVRKILRDETATPALNPGCGWCPVKDDCPEFQALPATAAGMAVGVKEIVDPVARLAWRDAANGVRLLLEKAVKGIDKEFKEQAAVLGQVIVGDQQFAVQEAWETQIDLRDLHRAMGDAFYDVVATSKTKIEGATADWSPSDAAAARACIVNVPAGTKVTRTKVKPE